MEGSGLRDRLRKGTRAAHARLDQRMQAAGWLTSAAGYTDYLGLMGDLLAWTAPSLAAVAAGGGPASHHAALSAALRAEGVEPGAVPDGQTLAVGPGLEPSPKLELRLAEAWGRAYVFEGSAVGAKHVQRRLAAALPHVTAWPFLWELVERDPDRWPRFLAALEASGADPVACVRGADAAFAFAAERVERRLSRGATA